MNFTSYILRRIKKVPSFSFLVLATIAIGVGANVGLFSVTKFVLLTAVGVREPERLVRLGLGGAPAIPFSGPAYEALHANPEFTDLAIWHKAAGLVLQTPDRAQTMTGALVNGGFFSLMGLKPAVGRFFDQAADQPGGGTTGWEAVLGYGFWEAEFNSDPAVIGKSITVNGAPVRITGVLPREFSGMSPPEVTEIVLPQHFLSVISPNEDRFSKPGYFEWSVFARLPKATTLSNLQAKLQVMEPQVRKAADPTGTIFTVEDFPGLSAGHLITVRSAELGASPEQRIIGRPLLAMDTLGAVLFALCVCNLALLFGGRLARQSQEAAVRLALGARGKQVAALSIGEAVALSIAGSIIAWPIAAMMARALSLFVQSTRGFRSFPSVLPGVALLLIGGAAGLIVAVLTSAGAALWQTRKQPAAALRTAGAARTGRFSAWIVGVEMFTAVMLLALAVAGILGSHWLLHEPSGFAADTSVTASLGLINAGRTPQSGNEKLTRILQDIANAPGVEAAATINIGPLSGAIANETYAAWLENGILRKHQNMWPATVSLHYFDAAGTRILRGRDFAMEDLAGAPVCVISASAAEALFGGDDPLEKYIYSMAGLQSKAPAPYCRVVGIAENAHLKSMSQPPDKAVYKLSTIPADNIIVRAASGSLAIQAISKAVRKIAPMSLTSSVTPMQLRVEQDLRVTRLLALFASICAAIAALILAIGVFGVLAIEVAARKKEIGIQISLGARPASLCMALVKRFSRPIASGFALGTACAVILVLQLADQYAVTRVIGVEACALGLICVLLVIMAAFTTPLRRALAISPAECLRSE